MQAGLRMMISVPLSPRIPIRKEGSCKVWDFGMCHPRFIALKTNSPLPTWDSSNLALVFFMLGAMSKPNFIVSA